MSKLKCETLWDDIDQRMYEILYRETAEGISLGQSYVAARIQRARKLLEKLLSRGWVLDDDLIRCAIRDTEEQRRKGYAPADHDGRSYGQHAKSVERAREEAQGSWFPSWMR